MRSCQLAGKNTIAANHLALLSHLFLHQWTYSHTETGCFVTLCIELCSVGYSILKWDNESREEGYPLRLHIRSH